MAFSILPRAMWTNTKPGGSTLNKSKVVGIAVHHPGDGNNIYANLTQQQVAAKFATYRSWHVNGNKWLDIGYNIGIDQAGRCWMLRGLDRVGGHAAPYNSTYLGVLLVIGNNEAPSAAAVKTFWELVAWLKSNGFPGIKNIMGHGELKNLDAGTTACPGKLTMPAIRAAQPGGGGSKPAPTPTPPSSKAPAFPLPKGYAYGPKSGPDWQVSGLSKRGDKLTGAGLKVWQAKMISLGYNLGPSGADGKYGSYTAAAAKAIQKSKKLVVDGLIGIATWNAAWS